MSRARLFTLWVLCVAVTPVLLMAMLVQTVAGARERALNMAVAFDQSGNALFGGDPRQTISTRTGRALLAGKRWARIAAPVVDALFGAGHCLSHANDPL